MRIALFLTVLATGPVVLADDGEVPWSGSVSLRGNYYWERSTRVIAPEGAIAVRSPSGAHVQARYLLDAITSASQASGLSTDKRFTETRHDIELGGGKELELGASLLDLTVSGRYSSEPDYKSFGASLSGSLSLNDRATVLSLGVHGTHDRVGEIIRGLARVGPDGRNISDRGLAGTLNALVLTTSWAQALTPVLTSEIGYDFGLVHGLQSSPYRLAIVAGVPLDDSHPEKRLRHTLHGRLAWYVRKTNTAVHLLYRAYVDSWDIAAVSPEVRVYEDLGRWVTVRGRYRLYTQTRAFFSHDSYPDETELRTTDPKLTEFHSHLVGGQLRVELGFFEAEWLRSATVDLSFDYIWNTNRYGNGVMAQTGVILPF